MNKPHKWGLMIKSNEIKISLAALLQDVLILYALQEIVLSKKYGHKSCTYIPLLQKGNMEETYYLQYNRDILFTFLDF